MSKVFSKVTANVKSKALSWKDKLLKPDGEKKIIDLSKLKLGLSVISTIAIIVGLVSEEDTPDSRSKPLDSPKIDASDFPKMDEEMVSFQILLDNGQTKSKRPAHRNYQGNRGAEKLSENGESKSQYTPMVKTARYDKVKIPPGVFAKARLIAGASNGVVRAVLEEDIKINSQVLAPKGSVLLGNGQSTEERLKVKFSKLVFKSGEFLRISGHGHDISDQMPGLIGSNVRSTSLQWAGAIGLGLLSGVAAGMQKDPSITDHNQRPSKKDALLHGVSTASMEQARMVGNDIKSTQPLIEVPEGSVFFILFDGDS